jgi:hypothetical protein
MSVAKNAGRTRRERAKISASVQTPVASLQSLWLPVALALLLGAISLLPRIAAAAILATSFRVAAFVLLAWTGVLSSRCIRSDAGVSRSIEVVLRKQHYIQAAVQFSVYVY